MGRLHAIVVLYIIRHVSVYILCRTSTATHCVAIAEVF